MSPFFAEIIAATRSLRRAPGFTALALAMLALGIGANVAVFSIFQSIILRPLPYPEPERLVGLTAANASKALTMPALSASDYRDIRERAGSFKSVAAYRPDFVSYAPQAGDPVQLVAANVTEDFFATFGTGPVRGRTFEAAEFSIEATRTAVLSHSAWRRHFGGRENVVGAVITLNDVPTTIVGIMPGDFREPELVEVWVPFPAEAPEYFARDSRFWTTIGRLAPGVGVAGARAEVAMIAAALAREHPATNSGWTASVRPLLELRVGGLRTSLALLVGAVGLVLLIACVNLANLMLARGVGRMQELAVRLALGATPRSLARGIFLESVLLAVIGGAAGAVIAALGLPQLTRLLPPGLVPRSHAIEVDGTALLFAIAVSAITGIVFGLLPAWQVTRTNVGEALKSGGSRGGTSRFVSRTQAALIVGQLAITLVVLAAAAVLMRSLLALQRTNPGFDPRGVLTVRLAPPPSKWETFQELAAYYDRALAEVQRVPGVESAAIDCSAPLSGISLRYPFLVEGRPRNAGSPDEAVFHATSADFFRTLRIPLAQGRALDARDHERSTKVCVISQALARQLFPDENPIGRRIQVLPWILREYREIVGVVGDVRQDNLADNPPPQIYVPQSQSPWFFSTLLVRTDGRSVSPAALQAALRRADPTASFNLGSLDRSIAATTTVPRLRAILFGVFGAIALGLSVFGIHASMAFSVRQRVREIGVRMAMGAGPGDVLREVLLRTARLAAAGVGIGLLGATALMQALRGTLHAVQPVDPWTLAALALLLPLAALAASLLPAIAAARLHPTAALQHE